MNAMYNLIISVLLLVMYNITKDGSCLIAAGLFAVAQALTELTKERR